MASSSKKKTTMAKMNRESAVRDRRLRKQAKKDARKLSGPEPAPEITREIDVQLATDAPLGPDGVPAARGAARQS